MNTVVIMGRLVADPEMRTTGSGLNVCNIRVAVDRDVKPDSEGQKADFFDVVCWRSTADFVNKYFMKGKPILVQGRLQQRQYEDKNGQKRSVVEIVAQNVEFCGGDKKATQVAPADLNGNMGFDEIVAPLDDGEIPF